MRAIALLRDARRPVVMAGTDLYWGHGEDALRALVEELRIPVFLNGLARGCVPADHELFFSRARSAGAARAPTSRSSSACRWTSGSASAARSASRPRSSWSTAREPARAHPRAVAGELYGVDRRRRSTRCGRRAPAARRRRRGSRSCAASRTRRARREREQLRDERAPLHPMRVYGELAQLLDRDAIVIGDGGDFVSYAGRMIDSYEPGCWLDPGPFGCLGSGPGYALAAKLAHPERQVVLLLGDGAFGFSGMEFDTLARHGVAVVGVMGNNGIWGLEKHPMEFIYGYSVGGGAARPRRATTRSSRRSAGTASSCARRPSCARRSSGRSRPVVPALVNVLTDPAVAYPRRSNLA